MKRSINALAFIFFLLFPLLSSAQEVILQEKVPADTSEDRFGPGRMHFAHLFISGGVAFGAPEGGGASIEEWGSGLYDIGLRYKFKILKRWEVGVGLRYQRESFRIEQDEDKKLFGSLQHRKEKLILNKMGTSFYNRFVFGKRGDFVGTFLDLGVYWDLSVGKQHLTVDKVEKPKKRGYKKVKSKRKGLTYVRDSHYGFLARLGYNRWVVFARYRYSDLFTETEFAKGFPELPRLQAGFQIGLHR